MGRKTRNGDEVQDRRYRAYQAYIRGTSMDEIGARFGVSGEQIRQDINAVTETLARQDKISDAREAKSRVVASLWAEIELSYRQEQKAFRADDARAAASYQANRIKIYSQLAKLGALERDIPTEDEAAAAMTWADIMVAGEVERRKGVEADATSDLPRLPAVGSE